MLRLLPKSSPWFIITYIQLRVTTTDFTHRVVIYRLAHAYFSCNTNQLKLGANNMANI